MRILLIGRTGQLGGDIQRNCPKDVEIWAPGREELDVLDPSTVERAIASFGPDVVINTSAMINVRLCEERCTEAYALNFLAVHDLALACKEAHALFVTFSTDYVFSGETTEPYAEDPTPGPVQVYGQSKLAGEYAALGANPGRTLVVRTCGLYGASGAQSKGGNFVDKRLADAARGGSMEMGSDQTVCPTYTDDLARATLKLLAVEGGPPPGVYHLANEGGCTWYEFTRAIFELAGADMDVTPVDRGGMDGPVRKPIYSVLANTRARALGITLPPWKDALERYLRAKYPERFSG
jgi:dTDP-4-dehydrorhamnose reductase